MAKKLIRFTDVYDCKSIYIDPTEVIAIKDNVSFNKNYTASPHLNSGLSSTSINDICQTIIYIRGSGLTIHVAEHIAIVTALLQGKDPNPAQIIFGKN